MKEASDQAPFKRCPIRQVSRVAIASAFLSVFVCVGEALAAPAIFHVSGNVASGGDGSEERPFATLEAARDAIRALTRTGTLPSDGAMVRIAPGTLRRNTSFELNSDDSGGSASAPIIWQGDENEPSILSGGVSLAAEDFSLVTDPAVLARLPENARGRVLQADLRRLGLKNIDRMPLAGHGMNYLTGVTPWRAGPPAMEVFLDGRALPVARWPNEGYARVASVVERGSVPRGWHSDLIGKQSGFHGGGYIPPEKRENPPQGFAITIEGDRALRWRNATDAMLFGYWFYDWSDQRVEVAGIDASGVIRSIQPSAYGVRAKQRFYVYSLLEELDAPGEWFVDRAAGLLYLFPPDGGLNGRPVEISLLTSPLVRIRNASYVRFENIHFTTARGIGIEIRGGQENSVMHCEFRQLASLAVSLSGGSKHAVINSRIHGMGAGGIEIEAGDRRTLSPAGHRVENCEITDYARLVRTYTAAIDIRGVGNIVRANRISDGPHVGIRFAGNDHLIEGNDISRVCQEADDMGAIYAGRDVTARGNVIKNNYIHDIPSPSEHERPLGCHGVYLDDQQCGTLIEGNVFHNIGGLNVVINGGRDNTVIRNVFTVSEAFLPRVITLRRWAAIGISNIGLDPKRINKSNPRPPMPDGLLFNRPPYDKYPNLAGILADNPLAPKHNRVEGNLVIGLPLFFYHRFPNTTLTEEQLLEWNHLADNTSFTPGTKSD